MSRFGKVIEAHIEETGGGCYTYWGKLDTGKYFVFGLNSLAISDADYSIVFTPEFFEETGGDNTEWTKEHFLERYTYPSGKANPLILDAFSVLKAQDGANIDFLNNLENSELCI